MERVLITGISGFSAAYLVDHLRGACPYQAQYFGVGRRASAVPDGVDARVCDLTDAGATRDLLSDVQPTRVFHLAGACTNEFDADYLGNVVTTRNLLEAGLGLADRRSCRFLVPGSAAEYGLVAKGGTAVPETHSSNPVSVYGLTKAFQTALAQFYARVADLQVVVARTFNLIGRGAPSRLLVGRIHEQIQAVRRGDATEIRLGNLSAARDYIDVRDAARAYVAILERGHRGEVYNVGSGKLTSIEEVLRLLLAQFGLDPSIVTADSQSFQPSDLSASFCADTRKLRNLGWSPTLAIEDSVKLFGA